VTNWVLLRGLGRESRHWGEFPGLLGMASGVFRVDCLDLPGNGCLNAESSLASVELMAEHCHQQLLRLELPRPCRVLAMSLGAMVAVAWAEKYPNDFKAMVLINTSLRRHNPLRDRLQWRGIGVLLRFLLLPASDAAIEQATLELTSAGKRDAQSRRDIVDAWLQWRRMNPVSRANMVRQLKAAAGYQGGATAPSVPCLLLASAGDKLVDSRCSGQLAQAWQVPLMLHPWAGHDLPLDDPEWVVSQIEAWQRLLPGH
jgi:pimeloyl-ACP methyl ester carboxylesterase